MKFILQNLFFFGVLFSFSCAPTPLKKTSLSSPTSLHCPSHLSKAACEKEFYIRPDKAKVLIGQCWNRLVQKESGRVELHVTVHALGFVKFAKVKAPFKNEKYETCLVEIAKRVKFSETKYDWKLVYPIDVKKGGDDN